MFNPLQALIWIAREVKQQADQQMQSQQEDLVRRLQELHRAFERGAIEEEEFAAGEERLLEQLERLGGQG